MVAAPYVVEEKVVEGRALSSGLPTSSRARGMIDLLQDLGRGLQLSGLILYLIKLVCFGVIFSGAPALGFSS